MADTPHLLRNAPFAVAVCLAALCLLPLGALRARAAEEDVPKGAIRAERYPPSFRLRVKKAIEEGAAHLYDLYGLERMGMLTGRRWLGAHDGYKLGADVLLSAQQPNGGWGNHVQTSYAVLFLKRATRPSETVVTTDGSGPSDATWGLRPDSTPRGYTRAGQEQPGKPAGTERVSRRGLGRHARPVVMVGRETSWSEAAPAADADADPPAWGVIPYDCRGPAAPATTEETPG